MKTTKREEVIKLLREAVSSGVLSSVDDESMRVIKIKTKDGGSFILEWYTNLCTIKSNGLSIWFDDIELSRTHPCFIGEIALSYCGAISGFIGTPLNHLRDSYDAKGGGE